MRWRGRLERVGSELVDRGNGLFSVCTPLQVSNKANTQGLLKCFLHADKIVLKGLFQLINVGLALLRLDLRGFDADQQANKREEVGKGRSVLVNFVLNRIYPLQTVSFWAIS